MVADLLACQDGYYGFDSLDDYLRLDYLAKAKQSIEQGDKKVCEAQDKRATLRREDLLSSTAYVSEGGVIERQHIRSLLSSYDLGVTYEDCGTNVFKVVGPKGYSHQMLADRYKNIVDSLEGDSAILKASFHFLEEDGELFAGSKTKLVIKVVEELKEDVI